MAWGCQRKEKRRSGSMRSMVISNGTRSCCFCSLATSASTAVPTIFPEMRAPGLNGASNFTPNQAPNSLKSHKARQTRLRGARRRIFFSMRSEIIGFCTGSGIVLCNLLVAHYHKGANKCNRKVAERRRAVGSRYGEVVSSARDQGKRVGPLLRNINGAARLAFEREH